MSVSYSYTNELLTHNETVPQNHHGDKINFQIGEPTAQAFDQAIPEVFAYATRVSSDSPPSSGALMEIALDHFSYTLLNWGRVDIGYRITLWCIEEDSAGGDMRRREITRWRNSESADVRIGVRTFNRSVGMAVEAAILDSVEAFAREFPQLPPMKSLDESGGCILQAKLEDDDRL